MRRTSRTKPRRTQACPQTACCCLAPTHNARQSRSFAPLPDTGAEALLRWNDPRTGLVLPSRFIPLLEETGLIYDVGRWSLRRAIEDYLRWRAAGLAVVLIAVDVS